MRRKAAEHFKFKILRKLMIDKNLNWKQVEEITGFTRQNISRSFIVNYEKTIDIVLQKVQEF